MGKPCEPGDVGFTTGTPLAPEDRLTSSEGCEVE